MRSQKTLKKNLGIGQTYQYSELCKIINEPVMKGGSKKSQRLRWQKYFDFELSPDGYKILYIPSRVREPDPLDSSGKFRKHINVLLVDYLQKHDNFCAMTLTQLMEFFGFVNKNFVNLEDSEFKDFIISNARTIIKNALNALDEKEIIFLSKTTYCIKDSIHVELALPEQMMVDQISENLLLELNCKDMREVYAKKKNRLYFQKMNAALKLCFGIQKTYARYSIEYTGKRVKYLTEQEISEKHFHINDVFIESLKKKKDAKEYLEQELVDKYIRLPS